MRRLTSSESECDLAPALVPELVVRDDAAGEILSAPLLRIDEIAVLPLVLLDQHRHQQVQPVHRRIIAFGQRRQPGAGVVFGGDHAASRRAWTSSAASAAGVMPGIRPAAASVAGRALVEQRHSLETYGREIGALLNRVASGHRSGLLVDAAAG